MPLYQHILIASPNKPASVLVDLFRGYCRTLVEFGGNLRSIENHGVRALPERTRRYRNTAEGDRYFWNVRYVSTYIDASARAMEELNRSLADDDSIIRHHYIRLRHNVAMAKGKTYSNPYRIEVKRAEPKMETRVDDEEEYDFDDEFDMDDDEEEGYEEMEDGDREDDKNVRVERKKV